MTDYLSPELLGIPFDQYQRYRLVAEVLDRLRTAGEKFLLLEVGGHPGLSRKFLEDDQVIVADMLSAGHSLDMIAGAEALPFPDRSFSAVLAVDVLEHIVPEERKQALAEMARISQDLLLLAAPFAYGLARSAEKMVFDFIKEWLGYEHKYLKEHLTHPAPDLVETESELVSLGFDTVVIPNGQIERWLLMMLGYYYFDGIPSAIELRRELTSFYNRNFFWSDLAEPAYRHLLVCTRQRLRQKPGALEDILSRKQQYPEPDYERFRLWLQLFMQGETRRLLEIKDDLESRLAEKELALSHQQKYITELENFNNRVKANIFYKIYRALFKGRQ